MSTVRRGVLATITASLLLSAPAAAAAVTPAAGLRYSVGTTFAGVCSDDWHTYGYGGLTSQFENYYDAYGHPIGWGKAGGAWMGPSAGPLCSDKLNYPGRWRLHMKSLTYGDQYGPEFTLVAATNPCQGKQNQITGVSTPSGNPTKLQALRGSLLSAGQKITADENVSLEFGDGTRLNISKGSSFKVQSCDSKQKDDMPFTIRLGLFLGRIWANIPGRVEHVNISTERIVCGNRGTIYWASYATGVSTVHVDKGSVVVSRVSGKWKPIIVGAGHTATQRGNKAPVVRKAPISLKPLF